MPQTEPEAEQELRVIQAKLHELRKQYRRQGYMPPYKLQWVNRLAQTGRLLLKAKNV